MKGLTMFFPIVLFLAAALLLSACQPGPTQPAVDVVPLAPSQTEEAVAPTAQVEPPSAPEAALEPTTAPEPTSQTSEAPEMLWTFDTQAAIWGTPTVEQNYVYIGSDDHRLYALEVSTGQPVWEFETGGMVRSKPAVANGLVYFASDDGSAYALDALLGTPAWKADIGNALDDETRANLGGGTSPLGWDYLQSSPVIFDGVLYIGSLDGKVYALDAASGDSLWTYQTGAKVRATATVDQGVVYIGSWDKNFYALDAKSGEVLWQTPLNGEVQSKPWVENGRVYCASRKASVVAMDAKTGKIQWEFPYGNNMWVESSPVVINDIVYIGSSGSQHVMALKADSGEIQSGYFSQAFHWSTPLVTDQTVYIGAASYRKAEYGGLYALTLVNGKLNLSKDYLRIVSMPDTKEYSGQWFGVAGSPVMVNGTIYYGALDGKLYAVRD